MNPSQKEEPIQRILRRLQEELDQDSFVIVPHWEDETDAVGVADPRDLNRLAYICSYPEGFFISLELEPTPGSDAPYADAGSFNFLTDDEVLAIVKQHLQIA